MYTDVMLDLETLGTVAGSVILSIGAVFFDRSAKYDSPIALGPEFHIVINTETCELMGLKTDQATVDWWAKQSIEARKTVDAAKEGGASLAEALVTFNGFLGTYDSNQVNVWGNGSDFDNALVLYAYKAVEVSQGWRYYRSRCYRTLVDLAGAAVPKRVQQGTFHNALDDAKSQALHALQCFAALRNET